MKSLEFTGLNDDEIKRIMSVIDRDFKLRQKESKRLEELKKIIRQEHERVEYLAGSKEFNYSRCIRCFKTFKIFFNPKEVCSLCKLYVCHDCATFNKQTKTWACKLCLKLQELESLTTDWFYAETGKKYKRCGSAKVVRELYKREKELSEIDEDVGYGTLQKSLSTDSKDSGSVISYVIRDKNLRSELNEYSKRLNFLIDNLNSELSGRGKVNLKDHLQQITSEISRARMALSGPLRHSNRKLGTYEIDLQNLIIQKTEEILHTNLQEFHKILITSNFDQKLAQIILNTFTKQKIPQVPSKPQRQSSVPLSRNDNLRKVSFSGTPVVDEEDTEKEEEEDDDDDDDCSQERTPTERVLDDHNYRFIDTNVETIKKSTERVADWKLNCTLIESKIVPSDNDEQDEYSTWF